MDIHGLHEYVAICTLLNYISEGSVTSNINYKVLCRTKIEVKILWLYRIIQSLPWIYHLNPRAHNIVRDFKISR